MNQQQAEVTEMVLKVTCINVSINAVDDDDVVKIKVPERSMVVNVTVDPTNVNYVNLHVLTSAASKDVTDCLIMLLPTDVEKNMINWQYAGSVMTSKGMRHVFVHPL